MAKRKKRERETVHLYFPEPGEIQLAIFEIQGANRMDGARVARLTIGTIHFAFSPAQAREIGRGLIQAAKRIEKRQGPAEEEASGDEG